MKRALLAFDGSNFIKRHLKSRFLEDKYRVGQFNFGKFCEPLAQPDVLYFENNKIFSPPKEKKNFARNRATKSGAFLLGAAFFMRIAGSSHESESQKSLCGAAVNKHLEVRKCSQ